MHDRACALPAHALGFELERARALAIEQCMRTCARA
jgi:hypothetical protein